MLRKGLLVLMVACLCWAGCAVKSGVQEGNLFISPINPPGTIKISQEFQYLGKVSEKRLINDTMSITRTYLDYESHIFAVIGENNIVKKSVIIIVEQLQEGSWYIEENFFDKLGGKLKSGDEKYGDINFQFAVFLSLMPPFENNFIKVKGFQVPDCFMGKILGRKKVDRQGVIMIFYLDDIKNLGGHPCKDWVINAKRLLLEQQKSLDQFEKNLASDVQISQ